MSKSDFEKHIWMSQQILLSSEGSYIIKSQHMAAAPSAEEKFTNAVKEGHGIYLSSFSLFVFLTVIPTEIM